MNSYEIDQNDKKIIYGVCDINQIWTTSKCKVRNRGVLCDEVWDHCGGQISGSGYMSDGEYKVNSIEEYFDYFVSYQNELLGMTEFKI